MSEDAEIRAPMPENVTLEHEADGLRVSYRWFSAKYLFMILFCAVWDGFLVFWYRMALAHPSPGSVMLWFPVVHVVAGLGITYSTLAGLVNRTTVRASNNELTIRHGPLPWFGERTIPASEIAQIYREQIMSTSRNGTSTTYRLSAVLHDDRKRKLLTCDSADVALYLEQEVERYLGIADRRVAGEMPK
jgi:hypothetical protein